MSEPVDPGLLFVIGGAEDKLKRRTVLRHFVDACGGTDARIAVIPTASTLGPEILQVYDALFRRLGAAEVVGARPESREQAGDPALVGRLDDVTGIFMTGGNQLKLSAIVCGTPVIVADDSGCAEIIRSTGGGDIVPAGDDAALAAAIERLLRARVWWRHMASRAAGVIRTRFCGTAVCAELEAMYGELVA